MARGLETKAGGVAPRKEHLPGAISLGGSFIQHLLPARATAALASPCFDVISPEQARIPHQKHLCTGERLPP